MAHYLPMLAISLEKGGEKEVPRNGDFPFKYVAALPAAKCNTYKITALSKPEVDFQLLTGSFFVGGFPMHLAPKVLRVVNWPLRPTKHAHPKL